MNTVGEVDLFGNLIVCTATNAHGATPYIEFRRQGADDDYTDWRLYNSSTGVLSLDTNLIDTTNNITYSKNLFNFTPETSSAIPAFWPGTNGTILLGKDTQKWGDIYASLMSPDKVRINTTSTTSQNLYVNGTVRVYLGSSNVSVKDRKFTIAGGNTSQYEISIGGEAIQAYNASQVAKNLFFQPYSGDIYIGSSGDTLAASALLPNRNNRHNIGSTTYKWANIYATNLNGLLNVSVLADSTTGNETYRSTFLVGTTSKTGGNQELYIEPLVRTYTKYNTSKTVESIEWIVGRQSGDETGIPGCITLYGGNQYITYIKPNASLTATRTLTLPNTSGTVALTSDISSSVANYLPLSGGTLTGTINVIVGANVSAQTAINFGDASNTYAKMTASTTGASAYWSKRWLVFYPGGDSNATTAASDYQSTVGFYMTTNTFMPKTNSSMDLGTSSARFASLYVDKISLGSNVNSNTQTFMIAGSTMSLSFGYRDIQAYTGTTASRLYLQYYGSDIQIGNNSDFIPVVGKLDISTTSGFKYSGMSQVTGNVTRPIWFMASENSSPLIGMPVYNSDFTYNPGTGNMSVKLITLDSATYTTTTTAGIVFYNSSALCGHIGAATGGAASGSIGLQTTGQIVFRAGATLSSNVLDGDYGMNLTSTELAPKTNAAALNTTGALTLGSSTAQWATTYSKQYVVDTHVMLAYDSTDKSLNFNFT